MDITNAQKALNAKGASLTVDGSLGPHSMVALLAATRGNPGYSDDFLLSIAVPLVAALPVADISTTLRLRHFLAQSACETFAFRRLIESDGGDPHYFDRYEGSKILGNTQPGDGARFPGRGLLDTTGRWNYTLLAKVSGLDCVNHPEILAEPANACTAAVSFWAYRKVNVLADANDIVGVTKAVNGGVNGLADRETYFARLEALAA